MVEDTIGHEADRRESPNPFPIAWIDFREARIPFIPHMATLSPEFGQPVYFDQESMLYLPVGSEAVLIDKTHREPRYLVFRHRSPTEEQTYGRLVSYLGKALEVRTSHDKISLGVTQVVRIMKRENKRNGRILLPAAGHVKWELAAYIEHEM